MSSVQLLDKTRKIGRLLHNSNQGKVVFNGDEKVVKVVKDGLVRKHGFCPCRLPKLPEFFCPCDEFKGQLADPAYHGLCHCRLYLKP